MEGLIASLFWRLQGNYPIRGPRDGPRSGTRIPDVDLKKRGLKLCVQFEVVGKFWARF